MTDTLTRPRIDPRFARRWIEVHRANGRRRLRVITVAVGVLVVLALGAGLLYTPLLRVRHLRVEVRGAVASTTVVAFAGLAKPEPMIDVDAAGIARRLDAIPQLGGAKVARHWPGTVDIQVTVRTPIAAVSGRGASSSRWALVDATGRVVADVASPPISLPRLQLSVSQGSWSPPPPGLWLSGSLGPSVVPGTAPSAELDMNAASDSVSVPAGAAAALVVLQTLPASIIAEVQTIEVSSSGQISMNVLPATMAAGSIQVIFGDGALLSQKITALETLLDQGDLANVAQIDLTVPERPAALTAR